jgi:hypothetical protein
MKFCPVVPEICRGHVHVPKKERRRIIIRRNGAKTKCCLGDLIKRFLICLNIDFVTLCFIILSRVLYLMHQMCGITQVL